MNTFLTLLRRTAVAMGAIAALTVTSEANAQSGTITLSGGNGSCTYSSLTVNPTGAVDVTCDTGTPPPAGPGTFSLIANVANINTGTQTTTAFQVRRVGGTAGEVIVSYTASGSGGGCSAVDGGTLTFPALSAATQNIRVLAGNSSGDCTVTITVGAPGETGSASTLTKTIAVTAPVAGCPASDLPVKKLPGSGSATFGQFASPSGVITAFELPKTTSNSGIFKFSSTPISKPDAPWSVEVYISKCKGQIVQPAPGELDGCYLESANENLLTKTWLVSTTAANPTKEIMDGKKLCYTPGAFTVLRDGVTVQGTTQYYINTRYNYMSCGPYSACGWVPQWVRGTL